MDTHGIPRILRHAPHLAPLPAPLGARAYGHHTDISNPLLPEVIHIPIHDQREKQNAPRHNHLRNNIQCHQRIPHRRMDVSYHTPRCIPPIMAIQPPLHPRHPHIHRRNDHQHLLRQHHTTSPQARRHTSLYTAWRHVQICHLRQLSRRTHRMDRICHTILESRITRIRPMDIRQPRPARQSHTPQIYQRIRK